MDPVSLITALVEVLGLCAAAVEQLKKFWNAGRDLGTLMSRVGRAQQTIESILEVVRELKTAGLASLEFSLDVFVNPLKDVIRKILLQIQGVVSTEPGRLRPKFVQKLLWTMSRDKLVDLENELKELEVGMASQVGALNLLVSLKHLGVTRSNTLPIPTSEPEIHDAFSDTATLGPVELEEDAGAGKDHGEILNSLRVRTWLGNLDADKHDQEYVRLRDKLSDAAKWGYWDDVFDILESGHRIYEESWINAPRIKRGEGLEFISLWTPLHQAVYLGAPIEVVSKLLELGASRTLRTRWTEFPWPDMTPLELAQHLGVTHLTDILRPTIRVPIPYDTLNALQKQFHKLITHEMGDSFKDEEWFLPQLEVLLEHEPQQWTWFPVKFSQTPEIYGYWYRIDGRDLLIRSDSTRLRGMQQGYRVSVDGIFEVEQAIVS